MDCGRPPDSRATSRRRVASPSAAKTGAPALSSALSRLAGIPGERRQLKLPTFAVPFEHAGAPRQREPAETRFHYGNQRAALDLRQAELNQRRGFTGIVFARLLRTWMPAPRKSLRGIHRYDID